MKGKILVVGAILSVLVFQTGLAGAESDRRGTPPRENRGNEQEDELRGELEDARKNFLEQTEQERDELRNELESERDRLHDESGEIKDLVKRGELSPEEVEAFRQRRRETSDEIKERIERFRDNLQEHRADFRESMETQREELKERLKIVQDENRRDKVEHLYERINGLNERLMNHFVDVLDKLQGVLSRVVSRTDKAEANGVDGTSVRNAINDADVAIERAKNAVSEQTAKVYTFNISDEETLREDVDVAHEALRSDVTAVRDAVFAARDAVRKAAVALAQIPRIDEFEVEADDNDNTSDVGNGDASGNDNNSENQEE